MADANEQTNKDNIVSKKLPFHIGGPNTSLPFFAESFLGWSLCVSCLAVSGYHYGKSIVLSSGWYSGVYRSVRGLVRRVMGDWMTSRSLACTASSKHIESQAYNGNNEATWIPLTTHSRAELDKKSPWERYLALLRLLEKRYPEVLTPLTVVENERIPGKLGNVADPTLSSMDDDALSAKYKADAALVRVLRHDDICRRLASLAMRPYDASKFTTAGHKSSHPHTTTLLKQLPHNRLLQRMSKLWNRILTLPSLEEAKSFYRLPAPGATSVATARNKCHSNDANYPYRISLILPAFYEKGSHLFQKLTNALEMAVDPKEVEVVIVDAGGCSDLEMLLSLAGDDAECDKVKDGKSNHHWWGQVAIYSFDTGGGRGPCLNFGASVATGRILTFCHSDTTLPNEWDSRIISTLEHKGMDNDELSRLGITRANSCAFSFGIDTSHEGLSMPFESTTKTYYPPGIRAVETTANLRTRLYSLPYGDQVISLQAAVFHFLGGFPDQCLMEDYELVALLRRRAALFVAPSDGSGGLQKENVAIIPGTPALCSPRRWQKFGVLYVTYMNSKFVNLYAGARKMSPDDLFQLYYSRKPPERDDADSQWEIELRTILEG
mmetsp:Transcript_43015/g.90346  ORF Transcript_43015/g.90346 Transcript_43015/m.90346 type:complete len:607 (-) Transcript_43015:358-2178(-)